MNGSATSNIQPFCFREHWHRPIILCYSVRHCFFFLARRFARLLFLFLFATFVFLVVVTSRLITKIGFQLLKSWFVWLVGIFLVTLW